MMNEPPVTPSIRVHCTVDRSCLVESDEGVFCTKCRKHLIDLNRAAPTGPVHEGTCGFYRAMGVTALASTMALAACQKDQPGVIRVGEYTAPPERQENIRVGKIARPDATYPTAEFVPGREDRVISPYNGKEVDVSGLPAGTLVMDPHFPSKEKKFFRLPAKKDDAKQPEK